MRDLQDAADIELETVKTSSHEKNMVKVNAAKEKNAKVVKTATAEKEAATNKVKEAWVKADKLQHDLNLNIQASKAVEKDVQK